MASYRVMLFMTVLVCALLVQMVWVSAVSSTTTPSSPGTSTTTPYSLGTSTTTPSSSGTSTSTPSSPGTSTTTPYSPGTSTTTPYSPGTSTTTPSSSGTTTTTPSSSGTSTTTPSPPGTSTTTPYYLGTSTTTPSSPGTSTTTPLSPGTSTPTPASPSTSTTTPYYPGTSTTTPLSPGTSTTTPSSPGTSTTIPSSPGTSTTTPLSPGTSTTTPSSPGTSTTTPSSPGTSTTTQSSPGASTTTPSSPGTSTTTPSLSPGTSTTTPSSPGTSTTTPSSLGTLTTTPSLSPGTSTTTASSPGTSTTTPLSPGTSTTTPSSPGTSTTTPSSPGTSTTTPLSPGTSTTTPSSPGTSTTNNVINDPVMILSLPRTVSVKENDVAGLIIANITFSDIDVGQAHTWEINSSPAATFFDIDANGQVTVTESLNYEALGSDTTYALTITVRDALTSSTGVLNVVVFDVNEKPTFTKDVFALSSVELPGNNVALGTPNWGIQDQDVGDTHTYYMDCGTLGGYFNMAPSTGAVTQVFNYDIDQANLPTNVTCNVTVVDSGGLTDTATLVLFFAHTNDNQPIFVPARYQWFINYESRVGTTVGQVTALDDDAGVYGILTLDLDQSSIGTDQFAIDSSGIISVAIAPNSASSAISFGETLVITAIATDAGKESATATVTIIVMGTSSAAPTTTTKKWKTFFDSSGNVGWFVALVIFAIILLVYLTWLFCTCQGKHGCNAFKSALSSACRRKKVPQRVDIEDRAYVRRDPISQYRSSVRDPSGPKEVKSWRQGYRF